MLKRSAEGHLFRVEEGRGNQGAPGSTCSRVRRAPFRVNRMLGRRSIVELEAGSLKHQLCYDH